MTFRSFFPVLACAPVLCALALAGCGKPPARPQQAPEAGYVVIRAQAQPLTTELPGRTSPLAISEVRPQVNGIVLERLFTEGSTVQKGQSLYRIDPAPYRAAVAQAKAQLANVQANLATVKLKADRYADLVKIKAVSQQDFDDASAAAHQAEAAVQQAAAALETAQINLGYTDIKAPISGRIGLSTITQGALATAGQTNAMTTIQTLDPIYVDVTQSSAELLRLEHALQGGQVRKDAPLAARVKLMLEDGSAYPLEGKLQFTDVTVDPSSGAVTIRAVFPNPQGTLLPGMFVRAEVTEALAPDAILVPQEGVSRDAKGAPTVLVVNDQNKAELRSIQIGQAVGSNWLVTKGLKPGDKVITEGLQRLRDGVAVRPVPAGSAPARPAGPPGRPAGQGGGKP
ncbi:MAG TPA: efflux RND transporter periplasmic adaptor subunit [Caulobacteraceae bacterium]